MIHKALDMQLLLLLIKQIKVLAEFSQRVNVDVLNMGYTKLNIRFYLVRFLDYRKNFITK